MIALPLFITLVGGIVAVWLLTSGGNIACRWLLRTTGLANGPADIDETDRAGWIIGGLERLMLAFGIMTQRWEVLAAVIALKSVARYKKLDDKLPADIFLVGSLFSLIWAVVVTLVWAAVDRAIGIGTADMIAALVIAPSPIPDQPRFQRIGSMG